VRIVTRALGREAARGAAAPVLARVACIVVLTGVVGFALAQTPEELFELRSTLHTEPLHDVPVPADPGRFWIEVDGETHEGDVPPGFCGAAFSGVSEPTPGAQDRFSASASWRTDAGDAWRFEVIRVITLDEGAWRFGAHESDNVTLFYRKDGDLDRIGATDFDPDAGLFWLVATAFRGQPGDEQIRRSDGPGPFPNEAWPIVRVSEDGLRATADGVARVPVSVQHDDLELPFRFAVNCAPQEH